MLIIHPNSILRHPTTKLPEDEDAQDLVDKLKYHMKLNGGLGLSAPQIGSHYSVFVIDDRDYDVFINPHIINKSEEECEFSEGCLSLPGQFISISRPSEIFIEAENMKREKFRIHFYNHLARVFQHEYDHLFGKLIIDY